MNRAQMSEQTGFSSASKASARDDDAAPRRERPATNWGGNVSLTQARELREPSSVAAVAELVAAAAAGPAVTPVRAIGAAHSASTILQTRGVLLRLRRLQRIRPVDPRRCRSDVAAERLFEVDAGVSVRALNEFLARRGLTLPMTGAFTGMTYVGAVSTATHGSGIDHPPMCAQLRAVTVVDGTGRVLRIEPRDGCSTSSGHARAEPRCTLIQDDRWFRSVAVGLGCAGVITSVTIEAVPALYLEERRTRTSWRDVRETLTRVDANSGHPRDLRGSYSYEFVVNPYRLPRRRERTAVVKRRVRSTSCTCPAGATPPEGFRVNKSLVRAVDLLANRMRIRSIIPRSIEGALRQIPTRGARWGPAHELLGGVAELPRGYSIELALPMEAVTRALDTLIDVLEDARARDGWMLSGWMAVRFVAGARAYMAMSAGDEPRCFVEFLTLASNRHIGGLFERLTEVGLSLGARPHWGQHLATPIQGLARLYPDYPAWRRVIDEINSTRVFDGPFLRGLSAAQQRDQESA